MRSFTATLLLALLALLALSAVVRVQAQEDSAVVEAEAADFEAEFEGAMLETEAETETELEAETETETEVEAEAELETLLEAEQAAELTVSRRVHVKKAAQHKQGHKSKATTAKSAATKWVMYKQCDKRWGGTQIGTSSSTICKVGCAMSSVAMALTSKGKKMTPGSLNAWLKSHGGYSSGNLLNWAAVNGLGTLKLYNYYRGSGALSAAKLAGFVKQGWAAVVNVRGGGHWVLVTGQAGPSSFHVNDPFFKVNTYSIGDMSNFVIYSAR